MSRLLDRQTEIEATNGRLLAEERSKRERLYDYRAQAADDKLDANRRILERIRASHEDADRRILPVWEKNVEGAQRMIESIAEERSKRLDELAGRDHVTAQHELLVASFVAIEPDPKPLLDQVRETLTPKMFALFQRLCVRVSADELAKRRAALEKRRGQLIQLAQKHRFQIALATSVADALLAALADIERYSSSELTLLKGAVEYFIELDDDAHDLKDPNGFEGDAQVARSVLEVIGRADLASSVTSPVAVA